MTVTDPVTRTGAEPSETATDVVASGAPASPAGPWPLLAVRSLWAFMQAGYFGLITAAVTLYIWGKRAVVWLLAGPLARFVWARVVVGARALWRWAWGSGRVTVRLRVRRRVRCAVWIVAGVMWGGLLALIGSGAAVDQVAAGVVVAAVGFVPGLARMVVAVLAPGLYGRFDVWTLKTGQRLWVKREWPRVAGYCRLAVMERDGSRTTARIKTKAFPGVVEMRIPTLLGQTAGDIEREADAIRTGYGAHSFEVRSNGVPGLVTLRLFLHNALTSVRNAVMPTAVELESVPAGVRLDGAPARLTVRGRHTLVVGATGAGKGSVFWSVAAGYAPAIAAGLVQVWCIDMKKGVEAGMGWGLFHTVAVKRGQAIAVLRALVDIIDQRGAAMRGISRSFEPASGDPLHVLLIDELADLMAYADGDTKREADKLLSVILTQGRALGISVVSCVQNPRQEAVGQRNLYTQYVALRLNSEVETNMVLDSLAHQGPAHTINPDAKGVAYMVNDDGTASMVRFCFWDDDLIRSVAATYPSPSTVELPDVDLEAEQRRSLRRSLPALPGSLANMADNTENDTPSIRPAPIRPRAPRGPRKNPRNPQPEHPPVDVVPLAADATATDKETDS